MANMSCRKQALEQRQGDMTDYERTRGDRQILPHSNYSTSRQGTLRIYLVYEIQGLQLLRNANWTLRMKRVNKVSSAHPVHCREIIRSVLEKPLSRGISV